MKFTVSSTALYTRLQTLSHVLPSKTTLSMLQHVLFEIEGNKLRLTASDGEMTLFSTMDIEASDDNGRFALRPGALINGLREMGEQPITIEVNLQTYQSELTYQNGHSQFVAVNADNYPIPAPMAEGFRTATLPAKALLRGVSCAMFATSDDTSRPVMNGIHFDLSDNTRPGITFVASDGHKLIRHFSDLANIDEPAAFTLPKKPAKVLKDILSKAAGDAEIRFSNRNAEFRLEDYTLFCLLVDKNYPNYRSVIPKDNPFHVHLDREALLSALRRVVVFADESTSLLRLRLNVNDLIVSAANLDYSTMAEEHVACDYDGSPMTIGFKGFFLIDILNTLSSQDVVLQLADPSRAGIIVPAEQEEHEDMLMLLMPMMLND